MNKRIITTSLALVLAMMVVLAVGKTEGTAGLEPSQYVQVAEITPNINVDAGVDTLSYEISPPAQQVSALIIPSEVNEAELILEQKSIPGLAPSEPSKIQDVASTSPLLASLARVQYALDRLEQVAASTERAVVALENQVASR